MPPKRDIYVNIMDPVEKQDININNNNNNNNEKKRCSCKKCLFYKFFFLLCVIGFGGSYLYYNDCLNLNI